MAAPRASSFKALQNLSKSNQRSLHMTGAQAAPRLEANRKNAYLPYGLPELQAECRKRTLGASGTKHELIDRLAQHDNLQVRAMSIAVRRIAKETNPFSTTEPSSRSFSTTQGSTVDNCHLPELFGKDWAPSPALIRVPILPTILSDDAEARLEKYPDLEAAAGGYQGTLGGAAAIMKPEIESAGSHDGAQLSSLSDVGDGQSNELGVDTLTKLSSLIEKNAQQITEAVKHREIGTVREIWNSMLDDLLGPKKDSKS